MNRNARGDLHDFGLLTTQRFLDLLKKYLTEIEYIDVSAQVKGWSRSERSALNEFVGYEFVDIFHKITLRRPELTAEEMRRELLDICRVYSSLFDRSRPVYERAIWISQWASKHEDRARFTYELMLKFARDREPKLVLGFMAANPFFKDAVRLSHDPTLVVTTAFEKETPHPVVFGLYKHNRYSDEDWLAMSVDERKTIVNRLTDTAVGFVLENSGKLKSAPTYLASRLRTEGYVDGRPMFEIVQDAYALSPASTIDRIEQIAKLTRETHSFHAHAVGEVPMADTDEYAKFDSWFVDANWQLMFQGFEEGLFPDTYINIPEHSTQLIGKSFMLVSDRKLFTLGLRMGIYGNAWTPGYMKIGLELRDPTRKIERWRGLMDQTTHALAQRKWNIQNGGTPTDLKVPSIDEIGNQLRLAGIRENHISKIIACEGSDLRSLGLPFIDFDTMTVADWTNGRSRRIPSSITKRLDKARKHYIDGLVHLSSEMSLLESRGEPYSSQELRRAVRDWVMEWAQQARPAEIFNAL